MSLSKPNAATLLCRAFEGGKRLGLLQQGGQLDGFIENVAVVLNLTTSQAVVLAFCIIHSQYQSLAQQGLRVLQLRLSLLTDLNELPDEVLQGLRLLCASNRVRLPFPIKPPRFLLIIYIGTSPSRGVGLLPEPIIYIQTQNFGIRRIRRRH